MALEIRPATAVIADDVRKFDGKWAAQGAWYSNWIWGFDTKEDAQIVADALNESAENAADGYGSSL